jgi:hypothetical protein
MPKTIRTPEPNANLCYQGENYQSDDQGLVTLPDAAAQHFIESHSCMDPEKEHPHGLQVKALGKGFFVVVDEQGNPIHQGSVDRATAFSLVRSYKPATVVMDPNEDPEAPTTKAGVDRLPTEDPDKTAKENEVAQKNAVKDAERAERKAGKK